jgi:hypothetical protein
MKIIVEGTSDSVFKDVVRTRLETVKHLFPGWCDKVHVSIDMDGGQEDEMICLPNYEYRWMHIKVNPPFFENENWRATLVHEIQHAIFRPYIAKVEGLLLYWIEDTQLRSYLMQELNGAEESIAQDMTILAMKLMDEYK